MTELVPADILLLHGFMGAPWTMRLMARAAARAGLTPFTPWYESWANPFDRIVDRIARLAEARRLGRDRPLHIVGHSMGGLVARALVARLEPAQMGRMVMVGTPNAGSELADFCQRQRLLRPLLGRAAPALVTQRMLPALDDLGPPAYPVGIIAGNRPEPGPGDLFKVMPSPHDGKVSVASTHFPGQADHIVLPVMHSIMPFDRAVHRQTLAFLKDGRFLHPSGREDNLNP